MACRRNVSAVSCPIVFPCSMHANKIDGGTTILIFCFIGCSKRLVKCSKKKKKIIKIVRPRGAVKLLVWLLIFALVMS